MTANSDSYLLTNHARLRSGNKVWLIDSRTGIRRKLNLVVPRALVDEYCQNIKRSATLAVIKRRQLLEFKDKAGCVNWLPLLKWPDWQDHTAKTVAKVPALSSWRPCLRPSKLGSLCRGQRSCPWRIPFRWQAVTSALHIIATVAP
jgi:hypothetical protein